MNPIMKQKKSLPYVTMRNRPPESALEELISLLAERHIDKLYWPFGEDELHTVLEMAEGIRRKHKAMDNDRKS